MTLEFKKNKDFLICVDSDGCVIDGMTVKHVECFGPGIVEVFELRDYEKEVLDYWNYLNLYAKTRGINRFKGLVMALEDSISKGYLKLDITQLREWTKKTSELSNHSLQAQCDQKSDKALSLALEWSIWVNARIATLPDIKKQAFKGVKHVLEKAARVADIAVVSSANAGAVQEEWEQNQLLEYVDVLMTQEYGSKVDCIRLLIKREYRKDHMIMIGDAPGDVNAAKQCGILYYPIVPGQEEKAWSKFAEIVLPAFVTGAYGVEEMHVYEEDFFCILQ